MISGIYSLNDVDRNLPFYVGRSRHIYRRLKQHQSDWQEAENIAVRRGYVEMPVMRNRVSAFAFLALDGRPFDYSILEETSDIENAEREWIDSFIESGVPLANGFGAFTMQGRLQKIACPYSEVFGVSPTAFYYDYRIPVELIETITRLKRDRPDLAAQVVAGTLTANAAAIKAGFRHATWSAPTEFESLRAAIERRFPGWKLTKTSHD